MPPPPMDGNPPVAPFVSLARQCLEAKGFLDASTAQAAYRPAWASLTAESPDLNRAPY